MAFKNILVTGARGMLGSDLVPYLTAQGYNVTPITREQLDLLGTQERMVEVIGALEPEIIINTAAYTNVDKAESEPDLAMAINKDGTRKLALAAKETGAIFVHISTDFVFDGLKEEPYTIYDKPNPISMYGLSKYYGELMITELLEEYYIIRTSWLYGIHRRNFVQFVLDVSRTGRETPIVIDQIGSPTWTGSLCVAIETIMSSGQFGTHHAADDGELSRYEQALAICQAARLSSDHIEPITSHELHLPAARPHYSVLDCGDLAIPSWSTSFYAYLEQYKELYLAG